MRRGLLCLVVSGGLGLVGCSGSGSSEPTTHAASPATSAAKVGANPAPATAPQTTAVQVPANATPDQVVNVFLSALKAGDKATTASLLTAKAYAETSKANIEVDPQSSPNAQYQVRQPEYLPNNPNGAHVTSVWSETYDDGNVSYEIVWVLRRQAEGWRIAGMALQLVPGQEPAFLNFEDPEDMMKKRAEAMAAAQAPAAETATQPTEAAPIQGQRIER